MSERIRLHKQRLAAAKRAAEEHPKLPPRTAKQRDRRLVRRGRLPGGSTVVAVYDASKEEWAGSLTVGEQVFRGTANGLFRLLEELDTQYRDTSASVS